MTDCFCFLLTPLTLQIAHSGCTTPPDLADRHVNLEIGFGRRESAGLGLGGLAWAGRGRGGDEACVGWRHLRALGSIVAAFSVAPLLSSYTVNRTVHAPPPYARDRLVAGPVKPDHVRAARDRLLLF